MKYIVISDLHIGSRFCFRDELLGLLGNLPEDVGLVLNGDTVDHYPKYIDKDTEILDLLKSESLKREVIWLSGNHDRKYRLDGRHNIKTADSHVMNDSILAAHGDNFEDRRFYARWFVIVFRVLYNLRLRLGASPVHVAEYAKHFPGLYSSFRNKVRSNAVEHARKMGLDAVICGHTHYFEDTVIGGIRYINTGSWTEKPIHFVSIDDGHIDVKRIED